MSDDPAPQFEKLQQQVMTAAHEHWRILLAQGVVMIVLGGFAVLLPNIATLAIEILIGSLFLFGGLIRLLSLARCRGIPGHSWSVVLALLATILGVVLLAQPAQGALTLTMVLVGFFILEGVLSVVIGLAVRATVRGWGWTDSAESSTSSSPISSGVAGRTAQPGQSDCWWVSTCSSLACPWQ